MLHVVAADLFHGSTCLVTRRAAHKRSPHQWEFPGGQVEANETPEDALVREIREELGLDIVVTSFLGRNESPPICLDLYAATILGGTLTLHDHDQALWLGKEQLDDLAWSLPDVPLIAAVKAYLDPDQSVKSRES